MSNIIDSIRLSGTTYQIQGGSITVDTELDSGSTNPVQNKVIYNKIDEVEEVTAAGLNALNDELGGKQDTLVSGTNIKTINNESILGSGNIDIQSGGKAIEAGRGISITTGETADTVSFNLPISAGTGTNSIIEGDASNKASGSSSHAEGSNTKANGSYSHAEGFYSTAKGTYSHAEGFGANANGANSHAEGGATNANGSSSHAEGDTTTAKGNYSHAEGNSTTANGRASHAEGYSTVTNNQSEHASGQYNVSSSVSTTFGDSGNTLFSVGNGTSTSARHNAFEIRQNGDIYLTKDGQDVKLQDQLGGGSITVDTALDSGSTNPVQNRVIYNKIDEVEEVTAAGLNALNDKINPTVELTQAEYDALTEKDPNTYYIITDAQAGDLTNYYTKTETNTLLGGKQDTLVSGTNIKTINNESILGSGNIDIQSSSTYTAGRGISIANDAISVSLPISAGTGTASIVEGSTTSRATGAHSHAEGSSTIANGEESHAEGYSTTANTAYSHAEGNSTIASGASSHAEGTRTIANNSSEHASGRYNVSSKASDTFGNSGNTLFSVGNGTSVSARHNAFEIRQNGDIYCSDGTNDVKLQDTITATAANTTALGGLKLVKLTQAEYNALSTKDGSTLYIIVN